MICAFQRDRAHAIPKLVKSGEYTVAEAQEELTEMLGVVVEMDAPQDMKDAATVAVQAALVLVNDPGAGPTPPGGIN
jgi:hypothetical protein